MLPDRSADLCTRCAMCCDGTLFSHVDLSAAEAARLAELGVVLAPADGGGVRLPQGCSALKERRCGVYGARPSKCREFRCGVLAAMESGALSFEAADAALGETRALIDELGLRRPGESVLKTLLYAHWRDEVPGQDARLTRLDALLGQILKRPA